jgi:hypothetical protein
MPFLLIDDKTLDISEIKPCIRMYCTKFPPQPNQIFPNEDDILHTCWASSLVGETTTQRKPHFFGSYKTKISLVLMGIKFMK